MNIFVFRIFFSLFSLFSLRCSAAGRRGGDGENLANSDRPHYALEERTHARTVVVGTEDIMCVGMRAGLGKCIGRVYTRTGDRERDGERARKMMRRGE